MEEKLFTGTVSFVNHQKHYATIDYTDGGKKKTINFQTGIKDPALSGISEKDKKHYFRTGDSVSFQLKLTPRGDRLNAYNVKFLYNTELDKLLQKVKTENRFKGFLKVVDDDWFVKELHSYLFFPLVFSPWQIRPPETTFNEAFDFRIINIGKQNLSAELVQPHFIPAYKTAQKYYRDKSIIQATVTKVSPYAVYLDVIGKDIQAKLPVTDPENAAYKPGYKVNVRISYLSTDKIVVEKV
jgi:hypothetical protein